MTQPAAPSSPPIDSHPGSLPLPPTGASATRPSIPGVAWPLAIWLLIQTAALVLAAWRIPLSANYLRAGERSAIGLMLTAQIVCSALLFPLLLRDWRSTAVTFASAWPFLVLAATLSSLPISRTAAAGGYVTGWLVMLALWRIALPWRKWQFTVAALVALIAAGGPLLWYLAAENGPQGAEAPATDGRFGPVFAAMDWAAGGSHPRIDWLGLPVALSAGAAAALISTLFSRGFRRRFQKS